MTDHNEYQTSPIVITEVVRSAPAPMQYSLATQQRLKEFHLDADCRPSFGNITDDFNLLENLNRYAKVCEHLNVPISKMANSLARAIGMQNKGRFNVVVYDYLLAIPEYPPTVNGRREALIGEGRFCNLVCYKSKLFGVAVFPAAEHVVFYFPEFSTYNQNVQELIFSYGNKNLRFCPEKRALAFDFPPNYIQTSETPHSILLTATATLKRKLMDARDAPQTVKIIKMEPDANLLNQTTVESPQPEFIQLE